MKSCSISAGRSLIPAAALRPPPVGNFMHPRAEIWGYELDALPAGWACGRHPGLVDGNTPSHPPTTSAPVG